MQSLDSWAGDRDENTSFDSTLLQAVASALTASNLGCDVEAIPRMHWQLKKIGYEEWHRLERKPAQIPEAKAQWLLGAGYILTDFLIAPVITEQSPTAQLKSLGALLNLAACLCDQLLDAGLIADEVVPQLQLQPGRHGTTPVTMLVQVYWRSLSEILINPSLQATISKAFHHMVSAELNTVLPRRDSTYIAWLRKSSLPMVLMGLPAWNCAVEKAMSTLNYYEYLRWLYRVGFLFGLLDDVADYQSDLRSGHPNYFSVGSPARRKSAVCLGTMVAVHAETVMQKWDSLVPQTAHTAQLRTAFLNLAWAWLLPT